MSANRSLPRLMIADDDPVVQTLLVNALSARFDVVGVAADGDSAVELALSCHPHAALIDVEMPNGGGLRAVRGIHIAAPEIAIVMLSYDECHGLVRELIAAGATAYTRKGVGATLIAELLEGSIETQAYERNQPS